MVHSPIVEHHELAWTYMLPTEADFWERQNRRVLEACDFLFVLTLPGWEDSKGLAQEIEWAGELGMRTFYLDHNWIKYSGNKLYYNSKPTDG